MCVLQGLVLRCLAGRTVGLTVTGTVPGGWLPAPAAVRVDIHSLCAADASAGAAALRGRLAVADLQQLPADAMLL